MKMRLVDGSRMLGRQCAGTEMLISNGKDPI